MATTGNLYGSSTSNPNETLEPALLAVTTILFSVALTTYCLRIRARITPVFCLGLDDYFISIALVSHDTSEPPLPLLTTTVIRSRRVGFGHCLCSLWTWEAPILRDTGAWIYRSHQDRTSLVRPAHDVCLLHHVR